MNIPVLTVHMICVRLAASTAAAAVLLLLLVPHQRLLRTADAQRIRDVIFGSAAVADMETPPVRVSGQVGGQSAAANAHYCRMERGAEHSSCGLPYELSNFQGGRNVRISFVHCWSRYKSFIVESLHLSVTCLYISSAANHALQ